MTFIKFVKTQNDGTGKPDENDDYYFEMTEEDIKELDERRRKRLSGESKPYTWEEAKAMIIRNPKSDNNI